MQRRQSKYSLSFKSQALKDLQSPHAIVLRDGVWGQVDAKSLVIGDIVEIKQGDRIPADLRMLELKTITLKTDQVIHST